MLRALGLAACLPLVLGGCDCNGHLNDAVEITVLDFRTRQPPAVEPVGVLTEGRFTETMLWYGGVLYGGVGRPGRYTVEIRTKGYEVWRWRVTAASAECVGVETVEVTALLVPADTAKPSALTGPLGPFDR